MAAVRRAWHHRRGRPPPPRPQEHAHEQAPPPQPLLVATATASSSLPPPMRASDSDPASIVSASRSDADITPVVTAPAVAVVAGGGDRVVVTPRVAVTPPRPRRRRRRCTDEPPAANSRRVGVAPSPPTAAAAAIAPTVGGSSDRHFGLSSLKRRRTRTPAVAAAVATIGRLSSSTAMCGAGDPSTYCPRRPRRAAVAAAASTITTTAVAPTTSATPGPRDLAFLSTNAAVAVMDDPEVPCAGTADGLRDRVQRALLHVVLLPVVWMSVCWVLTAAMGIECVESLQHLAQRATATRTEAPAGINDDGDERQATAEQADAEGHEEPAKKRSRRGPSAASTSAPLAPRMVADGATDARCVCSPTILLTPPTAIPEPVPCRPPGRQRPSRHRRRRVYIWDLDETLVLFASLCSGQFARTHGKDLATGVAIGEQMMAYLLALLERHFFFSELHDGDVDHISSLPESPEAAEIWGWDKKAADPAAVRGGGGGGAVTTTAGAAAVVVSSVQDADPEAHVDLRALDKASPAYHRGLAARYARIRAIYEREAPSVEFLDCPESQWFAARQALVTSIDMFSSGWLREAREVLELIRDADGKRLHRQRRQSTDSNVTLSSADDEEDDEDLAADERSAKDDVAVIEDDEEESDDDDEDSPEPRDLNVLVTNTQLAPALCKCLIYGLDEFFPVDMVYSSSRVHKQRCFESIIARFGGRGGGGDVGGSSNQGSGDAPDDDGVEFVAIGDGAEEEHVSRVLGLPFWKIRSLDDLRRLRYDLELVGPCPVGPSSASSTTTATTAMAAATILRS